MFLISGIQPAMLKIIEPNTSSITYCDTQDDRPSEEVEAGRLLALASCVYSQWFVLMKSIMTRERVIARAKYESETGKKVWGELPYSKAPCVRQPLTSADLASSSAYESIIRATFGKKAADFAHDRFIRSISTGDKRSFKIRFLFYKASDGLKGTSLFEPFRKRLEDVVTEAEAAAGCTPDPSPRRMSLAEQERKRRKEMEPKQLTLFDYEEIVAEHEAKRRDEEDDKKNVAHPEERTESCSNHGDGDSVVRSVDSDICAVSSDSFDGSCDSVCRSACVADNDDSRLSGDTLLPQHMEASLQMRGSISSKQKAEENVTDREEVDAQVVRKTKSYASCAELIEDIKSGSVTPYQTSKEVVDDIKKGLITPSEAVIFLAELGKRKKRMDIVWQQSRIMNSDGSMIEPDQDDESPSDEELDEIDDDELVECDDGEVGLPSERGIFNRRDHESNDEW